MTQPSPLRPGDRIAILSPASIIDPALVEGACRTLSAWGFVPEVAPHALGSCGSFSGTRAERLADLRSALADPGVKAILCSRGGYGCVHLLDNLAADPALWRSPKWLIGFSDISALHALWGAKGIPSVHSSMAKHLTLGPDDDLNRRLLAILTRNPECCATGMAEPACPATEGATPEVYFPEVSWQAPAEIAPFCRPGTATATLAGGNLAVISALQGTPYSSIRPGTILMVEDIAEPIYKVERIFYQLRLSGVLGQLAGLIIGQFTEYRPSRDHNTMEEMLSQFSDDLPAGAPVAFSAPFGHIDRNYPLLLNTTATLTVTPTGHCTLSPA